MEKTASGAAQTNGAAKVPGANGNGVESPAKKRQRSPSYPAISLEEAIQRARTIYGHERRNAAALDVVVGHWGFKTKSSSGLLVAAAMKKYGLLVEVDGAKDRHVRLSQTALDIILDEREESPERDALIRAAALRPEIHRELWAKWGHELPSEATIRTHLLRDREFTEAAADQFIEEYRQTISFARLGESDTIPNQGEETNSKDSGEAMMETGAVITDNTGARAKPGNAPPGGKSITPPPAGALQDTFSLDEGLVALTYPANLSEASLEDFKDWVQIAVRKIERSIKRKSVGQGGEGN